MTATTLAPLFLQKFFDGNGAPLAFGQVSTFAAGTNTPIATWIDSAGITPNANPIPLNARGECSIWLLPNVAYKVSVSDALGNVLPGYPVDNVINSQLVTLFGGTDTGVANGYILNFASPIPANTNGQVIFWIPANSNTGPSTLNVNGGGPQPILNPNGTPLGANQILAGQYVSTIYFNGTWQLYGGSGVGVNVGTFGAEVPLPSATTTDLGSAPGHNVAVTGSVSITSFGTSAQLVAPIYVGRFTGSLVLTNSASLLLPGGNNITTAAGDAFIAEFMGSGNWRILIYQSSAAASSNFAVKAADTQRLSNATLTVDPDLSVTLLTGQYDYELFMLFDSVTAGAGFKFSVAGTAADSRGTSPAGATGFVNAAAYGPKLESFVGGTITYATVGTGSDSNQVLYKGSLLITTPGTFTIEWAQNSSTATNTTLRAGSYLTATLLAQKGSSSGVQHIYTTPTTAFETIPANVTTCTIEVWGGTGGGGIDFNSGGVVNGGGGGASGSYARTVISVAGQATKTMQYTVGAAGAIALAGATSAVSNGTFSVGTMTAPGGNGGHNASSGAGGLAGSAGAAATGGTAANVAGNPGTAGLNNAGGGTSGSGGPGVSGVNFGGFPGAPGGHSGNTGATGIVVFTYV